MTQARPSLSVRCWLCMVVLCAIARVVHAGTYSAAVLADRRIGPSPEGKAIVTPAMRTMAESNTWKWVSLSLVLVAVVGGALYGINRFYWNKPAAPVAPMTVIIAA